LRFGRLKSAEGNAFGALFVYQARSPTRRLHMNSGNTTEARQRTSSVPKLYTPVEIAEMLSVSLRTVRKWISNGELAHTRLSVSERLIRVREEDLNAFLNRSYQPVQSTPREREDSQEDVR
jgi:excisionase family DNA binding protein